MGEQRTPPFYRSPRQPPSGLALLRGSLADPASVIPASIYEEWALKLPGPGMPVVLSSRGRAAGPARQGDTFGRNGPLRRMMRRGWGDGLAAAEGEHWASQRHAASAAFRPHAVEAALPTMADVARRTVLRWRLGVAIELGTQFGRVVTEIVLATLLSRLDEVDLDEVARDIPPVTRQVTTFGLLDALPLPDRLINRIRRLGRSPQEARLRRLASRLAASAPSAEARNVLSLLRGVGPLADNALGFMIAGLETTALGAAWAAYLLALYPDWQDALRAEAGTAKNGAGGHNKLPLARQVPAPLSAGTDPRAMAVRRTSIQGYRM